MFFFGKKKANPSQPHPDWPWALNLGGRPSAELNWDILESELRKLNLEDPDSFLILEQEDPAEPGSYWFIQSAIALKGPNKDDYIVGVGWSGEDGPALVERCYHWKDLTAVIEIFERAFQREPLDLTGYESFF